MSFEEAPVIVVIMMNESRRSRTHRLNYIVGALKSSVIGLNASVRDSIAYFVTPQHQLSGRLSTMSFLDCNDCL